MNEIPNELILEICKKLDSYSLIKFSISNNRILQISKDLIKQRKSAEARRRQEFLETRSIRIFDVLFCENYQRVDQSIILGQIVLDRVFDATKFKKEIGILTSNIKDNWSFNLACIRFELQDKDWFNVSYNFWPKLIIDYKYNSKESEMFAQCKNRNKIDINLSMFVLHNNDSVYNRWFNSENSRIIIQKKYFVLD